MLAVAGSMVLVVGAAHAGAQVTFYLTVPLGTSAQGHVLGLRLDRAAAPPTVRILTPDSPLNRRALLDLQWGADKALRLDLDRRLTWDIGRQQWRDSTRPATFTLRLPTPDHSAPNRPRRAAQLAEPALNPARQPVLKPFAVEP